MYKLRQSFLAAALLGMLILGTAGIVLSEDAPADGDTSDGGMTNMTTVPAPLDGMSIPAAS